MKLPNGGKALIPERKLLDYILNVQHPVNAGHAVLFSELFGIGPANANVLREALAAAARDGDAVLGKPSAYGEKFAIRFDMTGRRGTYTILSIWIIKHGEERPRLVTAYVE